MASVFKEKRIFPYQASLLFDLVSDVESYPLFVPWCEHVHIIKCVNPSFMEQVRVSLRYKFFSTTYICTVELDREKGIIKAEGIRGAFRSLRQSWHFLEIPEGTLVEFCIECVLKSSFLERIFSTVAEEAQERIITAFEHRAHTLYAAREKTSGTR